MTIRTKLFGCLAALSAALVVLCAMLLYVARTDRAALDSLLVDRLVPIDKLSEVQNGYAVSIVDTAQKMRSGQLSASDAKQTIEAARVTIDKGWKVYSASEISDKEAVQAKDAEAKMAEADQAIDKLLALVGSGDQAGLDTFVKQQLYPAIDPVTNALDTLSQTQIDEGQLTARAATDQASRFQTLALVIALISAAVAFGAGYVIRSAVLRPLNGLVGAVKRLAADEKGVEITGVERSDEIGQLAQAVAGVRQLGIDRAAADARAAAEQKAVVTSLATSLKSLSSGDLTADVTADFPGEFMGLKRDFNGALAHLRSLIGSVMQSAAAIHTGSTEIAQASEDLARRTESNAASLEETAAAVTQIDQRIRATAQSADNTVARADEAIRAVGTGRSVADEAVGAMGRVAESAKGIDAVIEGLDKIAFQTRVLAMNAAVEAGRAGEAGRGFAVVADLVSALAMRAEEEAGRARDQLTATQGDIVAAVDMVQKVDGALADISSGVGTVHTLLASIAGDNQAQSVAISQISTAIGNMDQATQQNAAMVEETSAAARGLASEVTLLSDQAGAFNVGSEARATRAVRAERRAQPAAPAALLPMTSAAGATTKSDWASF